MAYYSKNGVYPYIIDDEHKVGIDLGTTNTIVTYFRKGKYRQLTFGTKNYMPSAVFVDEDGSVLVGDDAVERGKIDCSRLITSSKRNICDSEFVYPNGDTSLSQNMKKMTPKDVAVEILRYIKEKLIREKFCAPDEPIAAVITVPAKWNSDWGRNETKKAGIEAGFYMDDERGLLKEPSAAAINYTRTSVSGKKRIFVFDFGGGTLDFSVVDYECKKDKISMSVIATGGDENIGGDDIDKEIYDDILRAVKDDIGRDLSSLDASGLKEQDYSMVISEIHRLAVETKHALSGNDHYKVNSNVLYAHDEYTINYLLSRTKFNDILCREIFAKISDRIDEIIRNVSIDTIDEVILVGGSSLIPKVQEIVRGKFMKDITVYEPMTAVSAGAYEFLCNPFISENNNNDDERIKSDSITGEPQPLIIGTAYADITQNAVGIGVQRSYSNREKIFSCIIERNTRLPAKNVSPVYNIEYTDKPVEFEVYMRSAPVGFEEEDIVDLSNERFKKWKPVKFIMEDIVGDPNPQIRIKLEYKADNTLKISAINVHTGFEKIVFDTQKSDG